MKRYRIETTFGPRSAQVMAEWLRCHMDYPNDPYPEELDRLLLDLETIAGFKQQHA